MLTYFRKFSNSFFAKIFLFIVAIPFVFWGMGDLFRGGNIRTILKLDNEKISTQQFINFIKTNASAKQIESLDKSLKRKLLYQFIGEQLVNSEIKDLNIKLTDVALSKIIKNEKLFKKNNEFSRIEYEKFLVSNSLSAMTFESNINKQEKDRQFYEFIGGGIVPAKFLVNNEYNKSNNKRNIEIINLNDLLKNKIKFSNEQIQAYFNKNKNNYTEIYKTIRFKNMTPKDLTEDDEFSDFFFQKIDKIDDMIYEGNNLDFILKSFNLSNEKSVTINKLGKNKKFQKNNILSTELVNKIFEIDGNQKVLLFEEKDSYIIIELIKTETIQQELNDANIKKQILLQLKKETKRKFLSEYIAKINKRTFNKADFDGLSLKENVQIKKIKLENKNDNKILNQEILNQVYLHGEKQIIIVTDINFNEIFLIYIDKVENRSVNKKSDEYSKYFNLSKAKIKSNLYDTYDSYLKNKYKIDINYKVLDSLESYFR